MKNKSIICIVSIFLYFFCTELSAGDYIDDLIQLVKESPKTGMKKWTLKSLEYYKNNNKMYKKRDGFLISDMEEHGKDYITIDFFYDYGVSSISFLLTRKYIHSPRDFFEYHYQYKEEIFNNLLSYAVNAAKECVYVDGLNSANPPYFVVIRVFKDKKKYYSIYLQPENVFIKGANEEVTPKDFNASFQFCSFILYEYLINNTSKLLKNVFVRDDFLRFHERIEKY